MDREWRYLDLYKAKDGVAGGLPVWMCCRGTDGAPNCVENYHPKFHKDVLPGGNNSPDYADQQFALFNLM